MEATKKETFRPSLFLRVSMCFALIFWVSLFVFVIVVNEVPTRVYVGLGFLSVFFVIGTSYYGSQKITVDEKGVTYSGILRFFNFQWEDIKHIVISGKGMLTGYHVLTRQESFTFTSFLKGHRKLCRLIIERANLERPVPV